MLLYAGSKISSESITFFLKQAVHKQFFYPKSLPANSWKAFCVATDTDFTPQQILIPPFLLMLFLMIYQCLLLLSGTRVKKLLFG